MENQSIGFLRLKEVLEIIPVSRSSFLAAVKVGRYPRPISLGPRTVAWKKTDIIKLAEDLGKDEGGANNDLK